MIRNLSREQIEYVSRQYQKRLTVPDNWTWINILGELDMYADNKDLSVGVHLINDGFWESWITAWFTHNIEEGMRCIDIGANQGYFTWIMSELVGMNGWVDAFEPLPEYAKMLNKTKERGKYHNVSIHDCAVSNLTGQRVTLSVPGSLKGSSSIVQKFDDSYGPEDHYEVKTVKLDDMYFNVIDFIKVDAEGAEELIWDGSAYLRNQNPTAILMIEWDARRFTTGAFAKKIMKSHLVWLVDQDGHEMPLTYEDLMTINDVCMIVIRRRLD